MKEVSDSIENHKTQYKLPMATGQEFLSSESRLQTFAHLAQEIRRLEVAAIVAVDGRSASGKSTFAARLARALNAAIVHTDDLAWHHSFFDWWPLLLEQIIVPFRSGRAIDWKPEAWTAQGREGSIMVPKSQILILEGVSATRQELSEQINVPIWIETDVNVAEIRGLERDGPDGHDFWFEWQASEHPFFEADQPWTRAKLIVDGAPNLEHDPETQFVTVTNRLARRSV